MEDTESAFPHITIPTNIHTANIIFTNIILTADKHNIPTGKMHSNYMLLCASYRLFDLSVRSGTYSVRHALYETLVVDCDGFNVFNKVIELF